LFFSSSIHFKFQGVSLFVNCFFELFFGFVLCIANKHTSIYKEINSFYFFCILHIIGLWRKGRKVNNFFTIINVCKCHDLIFNFHSIVEIIKTWTYLFSKKDTCFFNFSFILVNFLVLFLVANGVQSKWKYSVHWKWNDIKW